MEDVFVFLFKASCIDLPEFPRMDGKSRGCGIRSLSLINGVTFDDIVNLCNNH